MTSLQGQEGHGLAFEDRSVQDVKLEFLRLPHTMIQRALPGRGSDSSPRFESVDHVRSLLNHVSLNSKFQFVLLS